MYLSVYVSLLVFEVMYTWARVCVEFHMLLKL